MKGEFNGITSLVGPTVEESSSAAAGAWPPLFTVCRRMVNAYAVPLRNLLNIHCQTIDMRPSVEAFKETFPVMSKAGWLRNLMYLDFIEWTNSFQEILKSWDAGNYTLLWPAECDYPLQITRYMTNQLTEIREKETALGTAAHKLFENHLEDERIKNMVDGVEKVTKKAPAATARAPSTPQRKADEVQSAYVQ